MTKNFTLLVFSAFALFSCVDKDYDLNDVNDDDIVFGKDFTIPMGNIEIPLNNLFDIIGSEPTEIEIPETFSKEYALGSGFDQSLIESLTERGDVELEVDIANVIPADLNLSLSFDDPVTGETISIFNSEIEGSTADGGNTHLTIPLTKELLEKIAESNGIKLDFTRISDDFLFTLDPNEIMKIALKVKQTGGIKL